MDLSTGSDFVLSENTNISLGECFLLLTRFHWPCDVNKSPENIQMRDGKTQTREISSQQWISNGGGFISPGKTEPCHSPGEVCGEGATRVRGIEARDVAKYPRNAQDSPLPPQRRIIQSQMSTALRWRNTGLEAVCEPLPGPQRGARSTGTQLGALGVDPKPVPCSRMQSLVILNLGTEKRAMCGFRELDRTPDRAGTQARACDMFTCKTVCVEIAHWTKSELQ